MTVAEYLEKDKRYFEYFKNAITLGVNYFEFEFVFGDSASVNLFYIEKNKCENPNDALTKLIIPYLYQNDCFRICDLDTENLQDDTTENLFKIIKEDLKQDIYYKTKFINSKIENLEKDFKFLINNSEKTKHFEYSLNKWNLTEKNILKIINNCLKKASKIKLTELSPGFEYFIETDIYFVLYNFKTGA